MPTNFEITVISLLVVNIIASVYYNYYNYNNEEYGPPRKVPQKLFAKKQKTK